MSLRYYKHSKTEVECQAVLVSRHFMFSADSEGRDQSENVHDMCVKQMSWL